jgi:hypothetical protein
MVVLAVLAAWLLLAALLGLSLGGAIHRAETEEQPERVADGAACPSGTAPVAPPVSSVAA